MRRCDTLRFVWCRTKHQASRLELDMHYRAILIVLSCALTIAWVPYASACGCINESLFDYHVADAVQVFVA